jgi:predicted RNase H-like HicB family nuclease
MFFPDLPNVITFGETKDEAFKNASDALNGAPGNRGYRRYIQSVKGHFKIDEEKIAEDEPA